MAQLASLIVIGADLTSIMGLRKVQAEFLPGRLLTKTSKERPYKNRQEPGLDYTRRS